MSNPKLTPTSTYTLNNGTKIPVAGFGLYQTEPKEATESTVNALKAGYRHLDSAQFYHNEKETVDAIASFLHDNPSVKREDIYYTTKLSPSIVGYEAIKKSIDESYAIAKKIGYIDLFLIHAPVTNKANRLASWKALQEAVESGKVKSIGISNYGVNHIKELLSWDGLKIKPVVNQVELHPFLPRVELVKESEKHDILLEAYTPLTQGRKFDDPDIQKVAKKHGYSPAQVLLRWGYDQGFIVLAKTVSEKRAKENYNVLKDVKLDAEDLELLNKPNLKEITSNWPFDPTEYVDPTE